MTRSRRTSLLIVAVVSAVLAVACSDRPEGDDRGTVDQDPIKLRVGFIQALDQFPIPVIVEQGFDRANGLAIEVETVAGGRAAIEALAAGDLDVALPGSMPVLAAARAGVVPGTVSIIGASARGDAQSPGLSMLVSKDVKDWSDLAGGTIAVNQLGSIGDVALRARLQREGVTVGRIVEIGLANQGLAVADGQVAGAVMVEPYLTQSTMRGDGHLLAPLIGEEPLPEFILTFIAVRTALLTEQPDAVSAFLRAHRAAVDWIGANDAEARRTMGRHLGLDSRVTKSMRMPALVRDARIDVEVLEAMQQTLAGADPALTIVPPSGLYDHDLLEELLE